MTRRRKVILKLPYIKWFCLIVKNSLKKPLHILCVLASSRETRRKILSLHHKPRLAHLFIACIYHRHIHARPPARNIQPGFVYA